MYFITIVKMRENNEIDEAKTIGYVSEISEADRCVRENVSDMFLGGQYQYAIICEVGTGIFPEIRNMQWYDYTIDEDYWINIKKCNTPEGLEEFTPYIMG